jgi:hypothetical protein
MNQEQERFEAWGIVDLFGHTRLAGRISEQTIGGETFIRVDVPNGEAFHTRLFGKGAIYGISFTDETIAREIAKRSEIRPVSAYEIRNLLESPSPPQTMYDDGPDR